MRRMLWLSSFFLVACTTDDGGEIASPDVGTPIPDAGVDVAPDVSPTVDTAVEPDVAEPDASPDVIEPPPPDLTDPLSSGQVRAGIVTDPAALLPGVKADGRPGDVKMYNAEVAFVIEGPGRAHGGYRYYGGNVIDAHVIGSGDDVFHEVFFAWNLMIFSPEEVEVISDGADGAAIVRLTGRTATFAWADSFLRPLLSPPPADLAVTMEYELRPDERVLRQRITLENDSGAPVNAQWPMVLSNQGDGLTMWRRGAGFAFAEGDTEALFLVGRHSSHAVMPMHEGLSVLVDYSNVSVSLEEPFLLAGGASTTREYHRFVDDGGSADIEGVVRQARQPAASAGRVEGALTAPEVALPTAWIALRDADGAPVAVVPVDGEGQWEAELPPGTYTARAYAEQHVPSEALEVEVAAGETVTVGHTIAASGVLRVLIRDSQGHPVEGRATVVATGETPSPYAPGDVRIGRKGDWTWTSAGSGGRISAVGYAIGGETEVSVPAGTYTTHASRGFAWEIDQADVTVAAGETAEVTLTIDKTVDTTGWLSADFHIHALRSPDSDTLYDVRARQAVTEALDLPILTEHVQIGGLEATAEALDLTDRIVGIHGQEVTTFEYGHFNAFPLVEDPTGVNYGAVFPYDKQPAELFSAIRDQSAGDEIIQINHPRGAALGSYFTWADLDPDTGEGEPGRWDTNWDAIEVFNGRCNGGDNVDTLHDWIGLTNHGLRKALASGSDSHSENDPIGMPRNWIQVDREAVASDPTSLVAPVRARRLFVSCGPFVRFTTADGAVGLGGLTGVDEGGEVAFRAEVQAPSWMPLQELRLYRNGVVIDVVPIEQGGGGVRLDALLSDTPAADAWYAVEVVGTGNLLPVHRHGPPNAFTNPIEVDADGDGEWTPPGPQ